MHVRESEQKIASYLAANPDHLHRFAEKGLSSEDLEYPGPFAVVQVIEQLPSKQRTSHDVIRRELKKKNVFEDRGGEKWWSDLLSKGHEGVDFPYHANRIQLATWLRSTDEPITEAKEALENGLSLEEKKQKVQAATTNLVEAQAETEPVVYDNEDLAEGVVELLTSDEPMDLYLPTGFPVVDELIDGLHVGRLNVIAARTNHGKSLFADQLGLNVAKRWVGGNKQVLKFDLENSDSEKKIRIAANLSGVKAQNIKRHAQHKEKLTEEEFTRVVEAAEKIEELPLTIDASQTVGPQQIRARIQSESAKKEVGLVIVDDIGNMSVQGADSQMEVAMDAVKGLHQIARSMEVPVLAINQINRQSVTSQGGKPKMHHLSWSDDVAKKPALVMMLHNERQHYEAQDVTQGDPPNGGLTWLFVRKNKGPQGGKLRLEMDKETLRLKDPNDQAPF